MVGTILQYYLKNFLSYSMFFRRDVGQAMSHNAESRVLKVIKINIFATN